MKGNIHKKMTFEDHFDRKYACWVQNNRKAWRFWKKKARRDFRRMNKKDQQTEKLEANIIENGGCIICGRPLEGNRLFVCEDCSEKMETEKLN